MELFSYYSRNCTMAIESFRLTAEIVFGFVLRKNLMVLRSYYWHCTQELFLMILRWPYGTLGIEPGLATYKTHAPLYCFSGLDHFLSAKISVYSIACFFLPYVSFTYLPHSPSSLSFSLFFLSRSLLSLCPLPNNHYTRILILGTGREDEKL